MRFRVHKTLTNQLLRRNVTLIGPETSEAFPSELARRAGTVEPKEQCPQTAYLLHVQHESQALSCTPLCAGPSPKAEKQLRRESDHAAREPLSSLTHTQSS